MKKIYAFIGAVLLIGLLVAYTMYTYRDQVRVFPKKETPSTILSNTIEDKAFLTVLDGFTDAIQHVEWIDEDAVAITTASGENKEYRFTTQALTTIDSVAQPSFPLTLDTGGTLDYNGDGVLTYQFETKATPIDAGLIKGLEKNWVLAPDHKKIIFVDQDTGKLKVFLLSNRKIYISVDPVKEIAKTKLNQVIGFSPNAGYFFLVSSLDNPKDATFSVYGADSAKAYAKDIMGFEPLWAPGKILKIAYRYTDSLIELENKKDAGLRYLPERIGFFDLRTKRATYMSLPEGGKLYGPMLWRDTELLATLCDQDRYITGLYRYNTKDKKAYLKSFEKAVELSKVLNIYTVLEGNKLAFSYHTQEGDFAVVIQGADEKNIVDLNLMHVNGMSTSIHFSPYGLIYYRGDKFTIQKIDAVRVILDATSADLSIYSSPLGSKLLVVVEQEGRRQILWVALDKL